MTRKEFIDHVTSSEKDIESKLDLYRIPEHEKRQIMQMVYAYANYLIGAEAAD